MILGFENFNSNLKNNDFSNTYNIGVAWDGSIQPLGELIDEINPDPQFIGFIKLSSKGINSETEAKELYNQTLRMIFFNFKFGPNYKKHPDFQSGIPETTEYLELMLSLHQGKNQNIRGFSQ